MGAMRLRTTLSEGRPIGGAEHAPESGGVLTAGVGFDGRIEFTADNRRDSIEDFVRCVTAIAVDDFVTSSPKGRSL